MDRIKKERNGLLDIIRTDGIDYQDIYGRSLFWYAQYLENVQMLISLGINVHTKSHLGYAPIHMQQDLPNLKLLVEYGADVNTTDGRGETPVDCAIEWGKIDILLFLMKHGGRKSKGSKFIILEYADYYIPDREKAESMYNEVLVLEVMVRALSTDMVRLLKTYFY